MNRIHQRGEVKGKQKSLCSYIYRLDTNSYIHAPRALILTAPSTIHETFPHHHGQEGCRSDIVPQDESDKHEEQKEKAEKIRIP